MTELVLRFLATYLLHSTVLVGLAILLDRIARPRAPEVRELVLRAALFGSVATAVFAVVGLPSASGPASVETVAVDARTTGAVSLDAAPFTLASSPALDSSGEVTAASEGPVSQKRVTVERTAFEVPALDDDLGAIAIALWLLVAAIALFRLAVAVRVQRGLASRLPPVEIDAAERALARRLGIADPRLVLDGRAGSPYVAARHTVALPGWAVALERDERRALLAHEFAHVLRRDPAWLLAIDAVRRAFWLQPLAWFAQSRLDALAELACDARAAHALGEGRSLARCLATCAEHVTQRHVPVFAPAMARRPSLFLSRVQRLLEDAPMSPRSLLSWKVLLPLGLCTFTFLLPTVIFRAALADEIGRHSNVSILERNGRQSIEFQDSDIDMSAEIEGSISFTDDESDVAKLSGEATIEQTVDGREHRIDFRNESGQVVRRYRVDGAERPLDASGRAWLAKAIPTLLRATGIDAEGRARRIHAKGGTNAVLAEIELIPGDYGRRAYIGALAEIATLAPSELDRLLGIVANLDSDYERRASYVAILDSQTLAPAQQATLLRGVSRMGSDYEKRTVLSSVIPKLSEDAEVAKAWDDALASVGSDYELRTIIGSTSDRELSKPMAAAAIAATDRIGSAYERRTALAGLTRHVAKYPELAGAWLDSATKVDSDFERRTVVLALLDDVELDARGYDALLDVVAKIDSDHERGNVLERVAKTMPADAALLAKYRGLAEAMGEYEQTQAMAALGRRVD